MSRPILIALMAAIPIEAANLKFVMFPIDVGFPPDTSWYINLLAGQWVWIHLPTILSLGWLQRTGMLRFERPLMFLNGWLETTILLIAVIFLFRWFRQRAKKSDPSQPDLTC